ncbi:G5 domain-containing protein [Gardnerella vaginalis]|uniref:aggregation-promoting factor C-terminal-like domain-containing protein n=1 Tax=Gardnerella vaginalis TaxID=2702 RepID=UPI00200F5E4B|nr:G5 domain-containing protein [Gardnerella vaginalis]UQA80185.1 G5 domain-containing protein [Gardnerella vaginalis]
MARRWTPQRFVIMRRLRVFICVLALVISSTGIFALSARKSIALIINGKTKVVTTYASTTQRLLQEQKVPVKTHDQVISTSGDMLADHATVTVRSAYQTSITVDGVTIPFWTVATSIDQLIGFFQANADHAAKITVNLQNIYNKLTGGLSINKKGPVTVICDNKTRVVPDGTLPASSILDSLGIVLGKEDQVTVSEENGKTLLRILRVTHGKESRNVVIPFSTVNVNDPSLAMGASVIKQAGVNGERIDLYNVTYVDGKAQSATLIKQSIVKPSIDQIVAIGAKSTPKTQNESKPSKRINKQEAKKPNSQTNQTQSQKTNTHQQNTQNQSTQQSTQNQNTQQNNNNNQQNSKQTAETSQAIKQTPAPTPTPAPAPADNPNGMVHATPEQAKLYAQAACAQLGWTGAMWEDLVKLWTKESNWRWNAENKGSGAYGIPQLLPADKMASAGANWHEDASIQITWGLSYIRSKYGNPSEAWKHSQEVGWY